MNHRRVGLDWQLAEVRNAEGDTELRYREARVSELRHTVNCNWIGFECFFQVLHIISYNDPYFLDLKHFLVVALYKIYIKYNYTINSVCLHSCACVYILFIGTDNVK